MCVCVCVCACGPRKPGEERVSVPLSSHPLLASKSIPACALECTPPTQPAHVHTDTHTHTRGTDSVHAQTPAPAPAHHTRSRPPAPTRGHEHVCHLALELHAIAERLEHEHRVQPLLDSLKRHLKVGVTQLQRTGGQGGGGGAGICNGSRQVVRWDLRTRQGAGGDA